MKSMKTYLSLPTLRIPGWKELRDGSFLSQALEKTDKTNEISVIKDFEVIVNIFKQKDVRF